MMQHASCTLISRADPNHLRLALPLFLSPVSAGFPSSAESFIEKALDLNDLIQHPAATFYVRVSGDSMVGAGIFDDDLLAVDRSITVRDGMIVIAVVEGQFTVKRFRRIKSGVMLLAENPAYPPIVVTGEQECEVWGVVVLNLRTFFPTR